MFLDLKMHSLCTLIDHLVAIVMLGKIPLCSEKSLSFKLGSNLVTEEAAAVHCHVHGTTLIPLVDMAHSDIGSSHYMIGKWSS